MKELNLTACDETLYTVLDEIKAHLKKLNCPEDIMTPILISAEEVYVNIAHYAYHPETGFATVKVDVVKDPLAVEITFVDNGVPYDPLAKPDPDVALPAGERPVGGLGIFLTKKLMDDVSYEYRDGQNILTLKKKL